MKKVILPILFLLLIACQTQKNKDLVELFVQNYNSYDISKINSVLADNIEFIENKKLTSKTKTDFLDDVKYFKIKKGQISIESIENEKNLVFTTEYISTYEMKVLNLEKTKIKKTYKINDNKIISIDITDTYIDANTEFEKFVFLQWIKVNYSNEYFVISNSETDSMTILKYNQLLSLYDKFDKKDEFKDLIKQDIAKKEQIEKEKKLKEIEKKKIEEKKNKIMSDFSGRWRDIDLPQDFIFYFTDNKKYIKLFGNDEPQKMYNFKVNVDDESISFETDGMTSQWEPVRVKMILRKYNEYNKDYIKLIGPSVTSRLEFVEKIQ